MRPSHVLPIILAGLCSVVGASATAQEAVNLFISPMGEPFRAADGQAYPIAAWFAGADANKDGMITRGEFRADALRFFKTLDVNGDGVLSELEVVHYEKDVAPEIVDATVDTSGARAVEDANGRKANIQLFSNQGATYYGVINSPEPVRATDGDFNRKITQDEWMAAADRRFRVLAGQDKDGFKLTDLPATSFLIQYRKERH